MTYIKALRVGGTTRSGRAFRGELTLRSGVQVVSADNAFGKTLLGTAIPWCLGLEPMYGLPNDDPARFPEAVRSTITLEGEDHAVDASWAEVVFAAHDGREVQLHRAIIGGDCSVVEVQETGAQGKVTELRLLARHNTFADPQTGLQAYLFEFWGLPKQELKTFRGTDVVLYLENLAPLFIIDQVAGWSVPQALQVRRYGTMEVEEGAVEYLLGGMMQLASRYQKQARQTTENEHKRRAEHIAEAVAVLFASQGWTYTPTTHGHPARIAKRWAELDLFAEAKHRFNYDFDAEVSRQDTDVEQLRVELATGAVDPRLATAAGRVSQRVVRLKTELHEHQLELASLERQLKDEQLLLASLKQRIASTKHLREFKKRGVGRLWVLECPTCHQHVEPETLHLQDQSVQEVSRYLESLERERRLFENNIAASEAALLQGRHRSSILTTELTQARISLDTVNQGVSVSREQLTALAQKLAAAERDADETRSFQRRLRAHQAQVTSWVAEVAIAFDGEATQATDWGDRVACFERHLNHYLRVWDHSALRAAPDARVVVVADGYTPMLDNRRLQNLGSASDQPRLVASYALALTAASAELGGNHPGFVFLDEPLQQNPDPHHRKAVPRVLGDLDVQGGQTLIFTSLDSQEVSEARGFGAQIMALGQAHSLEVMPSGSDDSAPKDGD